MLECSQLALVRGSRRLLVSAISRLPCQTPMMSSDEALSQPIKSPPDSRWTVKTVFMFEKSFSPNLYFIYLCLCSELSLVSSCSAEALARCQMPAARGQFRVAVMKLSLETFVQFPIRSRQKKKTQNKTLGSFEVNWWNMKARIPAMHSWSIQVKTPLACWCTKFIMIVFSIVATLGHYGKVTPGSDSLL